MRRKNNNNNNNNNKTNAVLDILLHEQQVPACCQTHSDYRPSKKAVKADTVNFANWLSLPFVVNDNENK